MTTLARHVVLEPVRDPRPAAERPKDIPDEPHAEHNYMVHNDYTKCVRCKGVYSSIAYRDRVMLFTENMGRAPYTLTWAQTPTPCPHCERTDFRVKQQQIEQHNAILPTKNAERVKDWQIREDARKGIVPGRRPRVMELEQ